MFAGCANTGFRFTLFTVIVNDFPSDSEPSVAFTDAVAVPASENQGARALFPVAVPVPCVVVVTITYAGQEPLLNVSGYPSRSDRQTGRLATSPYATYQ